MFCTLNYRKLLNSSLAGAKGVVNEAQSITTNENAQSVRGCNIFISVLLEELKAFRYFIFVYCLLCLYKKSNTEIIT